MATEKRLIDAPSLVIELARRITPMVLTDRPADAIYKATLACIADAPTVDAVEVVPCKDCKHLNVLNRNDIYAHCPKTNTVFLPFELDTRRHFCSLGERRMIMLRLFVKDNTNDNIHEYGTSPHDALILQKDGSLHYENLQCFGSTKYPEEGYSFCLYQGTVPPLDDPENDPYIDIAGEYYAKPQTNADRIRAMSDEELAEAFYNLVDKLQTGTMNDLSDLFCDGKNGCIDKDGNITCTPDMEKACVLRWLRSSVKEVTP